MSLNKYQNISPEELSEIVSFDRSNKKAVFDEYKSESMQAKQAEGAACLFNLLNEKGLALLADEVGMGKTIQALSVITALWHQNKNTKVLVLAPRNEVAFNWINEYETFINVHYKLNDDLVKTKIGNAIVNPAIFASNLYDLVSLVKQGWGKLFIGKITSFSSLLSKNDVNERLKTVGIKKKVKSKEKIDQVEEIAELISSEIKRCLVDEKFDLIVIDEAHYFRNVNGNSLRVKAAKKFFGEKLRKLSNRVLLLTATPNHSSSANIRAMASYFDDGCYQDPAISFDEILNKICVRRFRRLSNYNLIKYNYRSEKAMPSNFEGNKNAELFFGIYQKLLAQTYLNEKALGSKRNMLHFLEGTEFIPYEDEQEDEDSNHDNVRDQSDFSKGLDGDMLIKLSNEYKKIFNDYPAHPKYDKLMNELIRPEENLRRLNEKKLVFVRRIPSVREIANRGIHRYDEILLSKINKASGLDLKFSSTQNFRSYFNNKLATNSFSDVDQDDDDFSENEDEKIENVPNSKILDLFKVIKKKKIRSTSASNFRLRFVRSKSSAFNIFFSPGANYFDEPYNVEIEQTFYFKTHTEDNYFVSCLLDRLNNTKSISEYDKIRIKSSPISKLNVDPKEVKVLKPKVKLETLMTLYWKYAKDNKTRDEFLTLKNTYLNLSPYQKEALSMFIEKGVLLASSVLVDLFCTFLRVNRKEKLQALDLYKSFVKEFNKDMKQSSIIEIIDYSILHFDVISEKVFNLKDDVSLLDVKWENFYNAQPIYPYSAQTKNSKILSSFNTPFFPDILVSTSVLQEGVNLQYFCDNVIHYGVAWTPGDNEQRVGRIDRMFSKVERNLNMKGKGNAELKINYPYLENTIDQDHVSNFIYKKYFEETFIDKCDSSETQMTYDPETMGVDYWRDYFRSPQEVNLSDPYCAKEKLRDLGKPKFKLNLKESESKIESEILNTFSNIKDLPVYRSRKNSNTLCILDPTLQNERKQPVKVSLKYLPELSHVSGYLSYVLSLVTPMGSKRKDSLFDREYSRYIGIYEAYPNVKLCLDPSVNNDSDFGMYMRVDIPVFPNHLDRPLSNVELLTHYYNLISSADEIEKIVTKDDLKIRDEDLTFHIQEDTELLRNSRYKQKKASSWYNYNEKYLIRKSVSSKFNSLSLKEAWINNHHNNFLKFQGNHNYASLLVSLIKGDIQNIELNTLNYVFEQQFKK